MKIIYFVACSLLMNFNVNSQCVPIPSCSNITANLDGTGNVSVYPTDINNGSTDGCGGQVGLSFMHTANIGTNVSYVNYSELWQPFASDFTQARYQVLYTAAELSAQGLTTGSMITSVSFNIAEKNTTTPISNFEVSVAQVPVTTIGNASNDFYIAPMTVVKPAADYTTVLGWNDIPFDSPISWDGVSSLLVQTCHSGGSNGTSNTDGVYTYDVTGNTRVVSGYAQNCSALQGYYSHTKLPELKINYLNTTCGIIGTNVNYVNYSELWQPFASDFTQARYQVLYTASELSALGLSSGSLISSLSFNIAEKNTTTPISSFEVSVAQVPVITIGNASNDFYITPMTVVKPAADYTTILGWNDIPFEVPVFWDGVSSLLVQTCHSGGSNGTSNTDGVYTYDVTGDTRVVSGYAQNCSALQGYYSHNKLPEIRLCTVSNAPVDFTCADIGNNNLDLAVISSTFEVGSCSAIVTVDDITDPTAPTLADITDECTVTASSPVTTDNCAGTVTGTTTDPLNYTGEGTYTINWTFDDGNGNSIVVAQNVIINDVTDPTTPTLADITDECTVTAVAPTTTDNCAGTVTGTTTDPLTYTGEGAYTINWTFDDGNGNSSTQTQNVVIDDITAPTLDVVSLIDVTECFEATPSAPTATDNCAGALTGTPDVSFPISTQGTTVVTWTYDDGNGNTSTQTQNVIVNTINVSVMQAGSLLTANAAGVAYQWLDCDNGNAIVNGETNQTYTPAATGNYAVEVTENGCVDTSACYLVDYTSLDELSSVSPLVYPNPSNDGCFNVQFEGVISAVVLYDMLGRIIEIPFNVEQGIIDASSLDAGKYMISITSNKVVFIKQIVITK
ncbi:MAG: T9SS type A sorting domain-containing protein [Crocinitomicaceae bacterium]|nr:T9SS type A sorting domain-containing protein [Flavobacteriales bacterium]NQZ38433.1 T9SS type A sorting domain-containing protein [Crocinitomicaceae bacterium]